MGGWEQTVILVVIDGYDDVVTHDASHLVVVNSFFEQLFSKVILRMHNFDLNKKLYILLQLLFFE